MRKIVTSSKKIKKNKKRAMALAAARLYPQCSSAGGQSEDLSDDWVLIPIAEGNANKEMNNNFDPSSVLRNEVASLVSWLPFHV